MKIVKFAHTKIDNIKYGYESRIKWMKDVVVNLTTIGVPENVNKILSLEPNFAVNYESGDEPIKRIITDCEFIISDVQDDNLRNKLRAKAANIITNNKYTHQQNWLDVLIRSYVNETKHFLEKNRDIVVAQSDEGSRTIVPTRDDYQQKLEALLGDTTTYQCSEVEPTERLQNSMKNTLSAYVKKVFIDKEFHRSVTTENAVQPKLYILIKTHKQGCPGRPVASTWGSVHYKLARKLADILTPVMNQSHNTRNSDSLKEEMDRIKLVNDDVLVSYDVISLFTKIPRERIKLILGRRWPVIEKHTKITRHAFMRLIDVCITEGSYFVYKGRMDTQLGGLPMGSPLSPILAAIVLGKRM